MRLDAALVARGLARSRGQAHELIADGGVRVNGVLATRPATPVSDADTLDAASDPWVSRAAHKLLGALDASRTTVAGRGLDVGSSTGGFTQVLLARGCDEVVALDVGTAQLVASLRADHRVLVREQVNVRDLTLDHVGRRPVDLVVADVSFISLRLVIPPVARVARPGGWALLMVKPQFEVGRGGLDTHGVVTDRHLQEEAVAGVVDAASAVGWREEWRGESPLPGASGNREFFVKFAV